MEMQQVWDIYIYNKKFHVLQSYSYRDNFQLEFQNYRFDPSGIGKAVEYDTLGNITKITYQNYMRYYKTEEEGKKIKKKYPICWREAYLLAKQYAGIKDDKEDYELSRGDIKKNYWFVAFSNDYRNIYMVNAKTGKVK